MNTLILKNAILVNEGNEIHADVLIKGQRIERIDQDISDAKAKVLDIEGKFLLPGCIDDQVHFREPGLTQKADIRSESRAAVAGGVTSFMEMPNTQPQTLDANLLESKYERASLVSAANYSFYMGASNHNLDAVLQIQYDQVCGIKVFMGSSTGDMLVDDEKVLSDLFKHAPVLIATHCEDEQTIRDNLNFYIEKYGDQLDVSFHPIIRNREACFASSSMAVELAKQHGTRLHILHISTQNELALFDGSIPLDQKRITAEACVHHLFFDDKDYHVLGNQIKCNPAIKTAEDRKALAKALTSGVLDVVATDHAPHLWDEKQQHYSKAPSGLPLVQHSLRMMWTLAQENGWNLPFVVEKMAHNPAICFQVKDRGFIREGYYADLVVFDANAVSEVSHSELLYKCGWSPLNGKALKGRILQTYVSGNLAYDNEKIQEGNRGMRLEFNRKS